MTILFPAHPLKRQVPDPDFEAECVAAREQGFDCIFYSLEDLRAGEIKNAFAACQSADQEGEAILHRGWMMSDTLYLNLHGALVEKGYRPSVSPNHYSEAHYLPNAYSKIEGKTPESVWVIGKDIAAAWELYQKWQRPAAIVKDFVKSAKHRWNEACFVPANTGEKQFNDILTAFLQARGSLFEKGIVLRRFCEFIKLGDDIRGQPLHEVYRLFFWRGTLLAATPPLHGNGPLDQIAAWEAIASKFTNPFISMDLARRTDNSWMIVEVGDGGVSGLPASIEPAAFYRTLRQRLVSGG